MDTDKKFLQQAIRISENNVGKGEGPFGAVLTKDGVIISGAGNQVISSNDPTAHAEIRVIREASEKLKTFDLSGCTIYCSCEPCPMCLSAIYWARIDRIVYANTRLDAKDAGFDDLLIHNQLMKPAKSRLIPATQMLHEEGKRALQMWIEKENKIDY
jgi:tRNA(Arg) A34 adenosine deaminase TadA